MPADLFRSGVAATPARRRASLAPVSIAAHLLVLVAVIVVPQITSELVLPVPARPAVSAYTHVTLPAPPRVTVRPAREAAHTPSRRVVSIPLDAPDSIRPEGEILEEFGAPDALPGGPGNVGLEPIEGLEGTSPRAAPPPPPPARTILTVGGDIRPPRKLRHVAPHYPEIARSARVEGLVIIEAVIGEDGRVESTRVLRSQPLLEQAAVSAVRQWQFSPTLLNGKPVPVMMTVTVMFRLGKE